MFDKARSMMYETLRFAKIWREYILKLVRAFRRQEISLHFAENS